MTTLYYLFLTLVALPGILLIEIYFKLRGLKRYPGTAQSLILLRPAVGIGAVVWVALTLLLYLNVRT